MNRHFKRFLSLLLSFVVLMSLTLSASALSIRTIAANYGNEKGSDKLDKISRIILQWKSDWNKYRYSNGLRGEYFDNLNFGNQKLDRVDSRISFDWNGDSPDRKMGSDTFSIRWTGQISPRYTDNYTFSVIADDGVRLWINDVLIINESHDNGATEYKGVIGLEKDKAYNIKLEYYENQGDACVKLLWASPSQVKEIVPKERLYSQISSPITPVPVPTPTPTPTPVPVTQGAITLDLAAYFNEDAFSYDTNRTDGNFDGLKNSYSANLVNFSPVYDKVQFLMGTPSDGRSNSLYFNGQTIPVPQTRYSSIRLLGAATNGQQVVTVQFNYSDGTNSVESFAFKDWCSSEAQAGRIVETLAHRHTQSADEIITNYIYANSLTPNSGKTLISITLPTQRNMHLFAMTLIPVAQIWSGAGNGLSGEYYDNADLTNLKLSRVDTNVNFDWGLNAPASSMEADSFSVRWLGLLEPKYSETYTFYTVCDDGVRLWVNNTLLIDKWSDQAATEYSGSIALTAGTKVVIRMEYYEKLDKASAKLMWSGPSQVKEVIPTQFLYH